MPDWPEAVCLDAQARFRVECWKHGIYGDEDMSDELTQYATKVKEMLEGHFPGAKIFFDKSFVESAPAGLYELCFHDAVKVAKLHDGTFFWVEHPSEPFMTKMDVDKIFGPWKLVTEYDSEDRGENV
jgi:hypothetical protein